MRSAPKSAVDEIDAKIQTSVRAWVQQLARFWGFTGPHFGGWSSGITYQKLQEHKLPKCRNMSAAAGLWHGIVQSGRTPTAAERKMLYGDPETEFVGAACWFADRVDHWLNRMRQYEIDAEEEDSMYRDERRRELANDIKNLRHQPAILARVLDSAAQERALSDEGSAELAGSIEERLRNSHNLVTLIFSLLSSDIARKNAKALQISPATYYRNISAAKELLRTEMTQSLRDGDY
jgi:hypothetical protein